MMMDNDGAEPVESDFAAFEAAATAEPEQKPEEAKPEGEAAPVAADDAEKVEEQADEADDAGDDDGEEQPKKRRSKPASERIAELTARLRETERELEAARTGKKPANDAAPTGDELKKPDPSQFEFGEADPDYLDAMVEFKLETKEREKAQANQETQQRSDMIATINSGVAKAETDAKAKYEDFDTVIAEAVEARGGEPMPPLLTIGIGVSPVGGDLLYRLATDEAASARLEKLASGGMQTAPAMAMALGELEGEYLDADDDADLDMTDQLDMARMMGRMRARLKGDRAAAPEKKPEIRLTNAPEPPKQRARGGAGQFGTAPDTTDFAQFEKMAAGR